MPNYGLEICYGLFGFGYILPATYLPALARELMDDPKYFGWAWPLFGLAAAFSTVITSWGLRRANRMRVWAVAHLLMASGVLLSAIWSSIISLSLAAVLVGGTFLVITMVAMQEARARAESGATVVLARMTASFALGQLAGPVICGLFGYLMPDTFTVLHYGLEFSAAGLILSAIYLWRNR
jgi:predicted MFS family arabinose efflux permease